MCRNLWKAETCENVAETCENESTHFCNQALFAGVNQFPVQQSIYF